MQRQVSNPELQDSDSRQSPIAQHNFSQDKISLGAADQPVSLTIIPGKLDEEQVNPAALKKLNDESEMSSQNPHPHQASPGDGMMSPQLRASKASGQRASGVQRSQEAQQLPRMRASGQGSVQQSAKAPSQKSRVTAGKMPSNSKHGSQKSVQKV